MSDPTYRIDVEHLPGDLVGEWRATVWSVSADAIIEVCRADSADRVVARAQEWIAEQARKMRGFSIYTDDDGRPVEGHSVKA